MSSQTKLFYTHAAGTAFCTVLCVFLSKFLLIRNITICILYMDHLYVCLSVYLLSGIQVYASSDCDGEWSTEAL